MLEKNFVEFIRKEMKGLKTDGIIVVPAIYLRIEVHSNTHSGFYTILAVRPDLSTDVYSFKPLNRGVERIGFWTAEADRYGRSIKLTNRGQLLVPDKGVYSPIDGTKVR